LIEDWKNGGFGIYIHWPFCDAKCPYCDFNSFVSQSIDHDAWRKAYLSEISRYAAEFPDRVLHSVYFGGGTPSLMKVETVAAVLDFISQHWRLSNDVEVTLEANPSSVEIDRFQGYQVAGVNRVSLGVQALNDADLKKLGRIHSVKEAYKALDVAARVFSRTSFDLIYARQDQSLEAWEAELNQALTMANGHLSLYQLTIEPGTAFGDRYKRGRLAGLPSEDLSADMFEETRDICAQAGMHRYEVSNYAHPGDESRHNHVYWKYGDYIGIGPGAHGRLTDAPGQRWATETPTSPKVWLDAALNTVGTPEKRTLLSATEQSTEMLLIGLRLSEGIETARFERLAGQTLSQRGITDLQDLGFIEVTNGYVRLVDKHVGVLNAVIDRLLPD
jgi:oxygen-independent coproporphyrinogen-3 oxidase